MVFAPADIESDEHVDLVVVLDLCHQLAPPFAPVDSCDGASRHPRYERPRACSGLAPISDNPPPTRLGDNTPRIIKDRGDQSCRARQAATAQHAR